MLGVTRQTVARYVNEGRLPGTLVGKSFVIPRDAVVLLALDRFDPADTPLEVPPS